MVFVLLCVFIICVVFLLSFYLYRRVFYSPRAGQNDIYRLPPSEKDEAMKEYMRALIKNFADIPYESVETVSKDGLRLCGKYYHTHDGAPVVICFHGYRSTGIRDFSGGSKLIFGLNQNLLLIEERAQETSGGHTISFGVNERFDCLQWIDYVRQRFGEDTPIILYGASMGAATVLMASGLSLPKNVKGILADSPYTSPKEIICKVSTSSGSPTKLLWPFVYLGALIFGHFKLNDASALEAVVHACVPIVIIHGEADGFVPCEMGLRIQRANPALAKCYTFPDAGHCMSGLIDMPRYQKIVEAFMADIGL